MTLEFDYAWVISTKEAEGLACFLHVLQKCPKLLPGSLSGLVKGWLSGRAEVAAGFDVFDQGVTFLEG
jgi:hypothetical protein